MLSMGRINILGVGYAHPKVHLLPFVEMNQKNLGQRTR